MKSNLVFLVLLFLLFILPKCQHSKSVNNYETTGGFTGDSGYVYNSDLLKKIKFDTLDSLYQRITIHTSDTVGKYYKGNNGHYFSCIDASIGVPGFILVETLPNGTILAKEIFGVGIHDCCWNGRYDGFKKYGDYISFRVCTTGTGICGGSIKLFKSLQPQDKIESISQSLWYNSDGEDNYSDLTSTMQIKHDTVIMYYNVVDYIEKDNEKKIKSSDSFTIRYVDNNSKWTALDSTKHILDF